MTIEEKKKSKYVVTINTKHGTLDNPLFEKMAEKGDITSTSISELVGASITIIGHATATIETDDKSFSMSYYDTEEYGIVHSGNNTLFTESVEVYIEDINVFIIKAVKCKMGTAYKAVPCLSKAMKEPTPFNS